jgi:hypothetical protein
MFFVSFFVNCGVEKARNCAAILEKSVDEAMAHR